MKGEMEGRKGWWNFKERGILLFYFQNSKKFFSFFKKRRGIRRKTLKYTFGNPSFIIKIGKFISYQFLII